MTWKELFLRSKQTLIFANGATAQLQFCLGWGDRRLLRVQFETGQRLELPSAVDVSELISDPRIFIIEGKLLDQVLLFGGGQCYVVGSQGAVEHSFSLFRSEGDEEYWVTTFLERAPDLIIVYEAGVLAIDASFTVLWHQRKYYNDVLDGVEEDRLIFVRDHDTKWQMSLTDGAATIELPEVARKHRSIEEPV